jgi:hypothetical protein
MNLKPENAACRVVMNMIIPELAVAPWWLNRDQ